MLDDMTSFNQPPRWTEQGTQGHSNQQAWAQPGAPVPTGGYTGVAANTDERLAATGAHLSAAVAWLLSAGWLNFLGPLILWFVFRDRSPFVRRAAAGSFNFTVSMTIASLVGWLLVITVILAPLGALLIAASGVLTIVLGCIGALKTWRGESYTYPWQLRILS